MSDSLRFSWRELHPRRFFLETWKKLDEEAAEERRAAAEQGKGFDRRPLLVLAGGAFLLTLMEYFGMPDTFRQMVEWAAEQERIDGDGTFFQSLPDSPYWMLYHHAYWAIWRFLGFFLLTLPFLWWSRERVRDQFLSIRGFFEHLWIYLLAFAVVLILVAIVSYDPGFQTYYPFYKLSSRSYFDFIAWELLYALQFFSLEFFFRGWWLKSLKPALGSAAIFVMTAPYVMIHFGKEFPETLGAICAGIFLGTLAMRTRSIWGGFFVHVLVAVSMDVAALLQTTGLPTRFWP